PDRKPKGGVQGHSAPGDQWIGRHVFEPMPLRADAAGKKQDDVAREKAELERQKLRTHRPAEAQQKRGGARSQRGHCKDCVRRKRPRLFQPLRANRGAQRDIGGGEDQQRLDEPHRSGNDRAVTCEPAERRKKSVAVRRFRQGYRDRAKRENEDEERRAEPQKTLAKEFLRPMTRDSARRERTGDQKEQAHEKRLIVRDEERQNERRGRAARLD